jgi:DUF4097 and DUF4098 domain-containing protein YvlB
MLRASIVVMIVLALGIVTCSLGSKADEKFTEEFHQTYAVAPHGKIVLQHNTGSIRILTWDRNEMKVDAIKSAYAQPKLAEARINVETTADAVTLKTSYGEDTLTWRSDSSGRKNNPAVIDFVITIPKDAQLANVQLSNGDIEVSQVKGGVKASTLNGSLVADGLGGDIHLSVNNGKLNAKFDQIEKTQNITLASVNAEIVLNIPSDADADVKANSRNGRVESDFALQVKDVPEEYVSPNTRRGGGREISGTVGVGGARIIVGSDRGNIKIRRAQNTQASK